MRCRICGSSKKHMIYNAREMFYGLRTPFQYFECEECKCVQIVDVPEDISQYYPSNYYTGNLPAISDFSRFQGMEEQEYINNSLNLIEQYCLKGAIHTLDCSYLDVGCGNAGVARDLARMGLKKVVGIDAYLKPQHAFESDGCRIYQSDIYGVEEQFDIIMFCHSLEHMEDHQSVLSKAYELLNEKGICIIRIPIASYVWNIYHENWIQLDAPRHFILHSFKSLELLIEGTPFHIKGFWTDSTSEQFICSELYKRGIPLVTQQQSIMTDYFTMEELERFGKLTRELNEECLGDQITIVLEK